MSEILLPIRHRINHRQQMVRRRTGNGFSEVPTTKVTPRLSNAVPTCKDLFVRMWEWLVTNTRSMYGGRLRRTNARHVFSPKILNCYSRCTPDSHLRSNSSIKHNLCNLTGSLAHLIWNHTVTYVCRMIAKPCYLSEQVDILRTLIHRVSVLDLGCGPRWQIARSV